ncbi:DUF58 domain-containing protein [Nocardia asteroides NBRC 15531]|uniref:DUF58 domain-containing protein n=1 Tax=Nocardia asteroides NBRC 15531 TaxID=1110697 RepID=U5EIM7_NOCAS|nr:DUF58 domain-containing protein [Nocardia asteroides]TLF69030.1 DUF58 domain-containing protein [Nocardia asteroides NBRC 15531]UGT48503.1 DUF58 domain-containing protein [Nocardia asteroides]SFL61867.1 Uncharacterized conserved protein, DUF58 family, contains vWF domain [Nocardia asteroides]VEG32115.1 Uncharacterized conserved protein (some members contain a von Willebrand factor type A (vWA) domain) [Nocardia asteroides]GAD85014.1 hypothetical protein NCAST_25_04370 [Nocardia asteroides N
MVVTGRFALLATIAGALVMVLVPSWIGVVGASAALLALGVFDVALTARADTLTLTRDPLTIVRLGRSTVVELAVTNSGTATVRGVLWDAWPDSARADRRAHRLELAPRTRMRVRTELTPTYRGDRVAGAVTLRLLGPLGLAGRQSRVEVPARVRALPPFRSERLLRSKVKRLHHLEGRNVADIRGQGTEFDSFREYVAGDDVRSIDWRATARAADVLVRTWRPERNRHVLMVLDTGRASAGRVGEGTRLDTSIEAALLLGGLAAAAGDTVDLLAYDREVRAEVTGVGGNQLPLKLMHTLAGVTPRLVDTDADGLVRTVVSRVRRRALVVWFTSLDGPTVSEHLLPALPTLLRRHRVLIVSVTDPEIAAAARDRSSAAAVYTAAAAETVLAERALVRETLRRRGVDVVTAAPDQLPEALADEYLELKQSGSL